MHKEEAKEEEHHLQEEEEGEELPKEEEEVEGAQMEGETRKINNVNIVINLETMRGSVE